jgi:hypothetical protein
MLMLLGNPSHNVKTYICPYTGSHATRTYASNQLDFVAKPMPCCSNGVQSVPATDNLQHDN